mgnify:CR=1 FL=1
MTAFAQELRRHIRAAGGMSVHDYMARCNAHYYGTRDPLGAAGDFTTAPEISQMFGELIGLWALDLWTRAGAPKDIMLVELGPGRGTLLADALRAAPPLAAQARIHLIETSRSLRQAQAGRIPGATWHDSIDDIPRGAPLIVIANEFFDALPVRQQVRVSGGWKERQIVDEDGLRFAPTGTSIRETCPAATAIMARLGQRIGGDGGAALIIDYGYAGGEHGDTLQAVSRHRHADPLADPGEADLTAHVDFAALAEAANGLKVGGPVSQAAFLSALGIGLRAESLARRNPQAQEALSAAVHRLTAPAEMGALFKAMVLTHPAWPHPAGVPA